MSHENTVTEETIEESTETTNDSQSTETPSSTLESEETPTTESSPTEEVAVAAADGQEETSTDQEEEVVSPDHEEESQETAVETTEEDTQSVSSDQPRIHSELHQLVDLCTKYTEIGPIVARLATKLGYTKIADRVVRLGLEEDDSPIEYYFVAARLARDEDRKEDVLNVVNDALKSVVEAHKNGTGSLSSADKSRLLHVVRLGFACLMFDFDDIRSQPDFTTELSNHLSELEEFYKNDAFYHQLYAQSLWFSNTNASEDQWEKAVEHGAPEDVWNARGTWYKEASKNITAAEAAYRRGLEKTADSALLMHNLAQVLMDRAEASIRIDIPQSAVLLNEAEGYLRKAKRVAHRHSMRSHVYETLDRLRKLKARLDSATVLPEVGDVVTGRVISLKNYGAFIVLPTGHTGLLHSSEIDHYWVEDATTRYNENDAVQVKIIKVEDRKDGEGLRISLSRKALIEKPADFDESLAKPPRRRNESSNDERTNSNNRRNSNDKRSQNEKSSGRRKPKNNRRSNRKNNSPSQYRDSGTGATIADLLSAKLNLSKD